MADLTVPRGADDKITHYFKELRRGIDYRDAHIEEWEENEKHCYGEYDKEYDDHTRINKLGAYVESRTAALAHRNPRGRLSPRNEAGWTPIPVPVIDPHTGPVIDPMTGMPAIRTIPRFKVLEAGLNYFLSRPSFRAAANGRLGVKSALLTGIGVWKVGYCADYEQPEEEALPLPLEDALFQKIEWLRERYEFADDGTPLVDEQDMLVPKGRAPISEQWFVEWWDTKRMLFDPDGENDPASLRWVACESWRNLADVKADKTLKNTRDLQATAKLAQASSSMRIADQDQKPWDDESKMVRVFEFWDYVRGKLLVLADGHDKILRETDIPEGVCKKTGPWAYYRPVEKPSEWLGSAPATSLRKINAFYNEANRQAMSEMQKATTKMLADSRYFDAEAISRLNSPIKETIPVNMEKAPIGLTMEQCLLPVKYPTVMPEMFQFTQYVSANFDEVGGQPGESRGVATANTATQTNALTSREFLREEYQRAIYAETWRTILQKLLDSLQVNMTQEQAITIMDGDGYAFMTVLTPEMIQGDYDIEVDVADFEPLNKQQDRVNLVQMLTIVGQAPMLAADEQAFAGICEMFGIHDRRIARGISGMAQMQMMALMTAKTPEKPNAGPAEDDAQAISQTGGTL